MKQRTSSSSNSSSTCTRTSETANFTRQVEASTMAYRRCPRRATNTFTKSERLQLVCQRHRVGASTALHANYSHQSPYACTQPNSPMHRCNYAPTHQPTRSLVFLGCGSKNPAFDSRILLIIAGDIETNPGPVDTCQACTKTINEDAPRIICGKCSSLFHKSHTRLATREEQAAAQKNPGSWICFFCSDPTTEPTAVSILPQAVCAKVQCSKTIKEGDPRAICGSCSKSVHKKCTGLRQRIAQDAAANNIGSWTCQVCRGEATPLEQGPSKDSFKCGKKGCLTPVYAMNLHIICGKCDKPFHKSCSGIEKRTEQGQAARNPGSWNCPKCVLAETPDSVNENELGDEAKSSSKGFKEKSLCIMQWNADHLKSKLPELKVQLEANDVDVCMIQESKLKPTDSLPKLPGYVSIRHDRKGGMQGGGLVCLIKDTINHAVTITASKTATEALGIKIKCQKKQWIEVTNIYCPPQNSLGQLINLATDVIPTSPNSLIVGDFNAHSHAWDVVQPEDERGNDVLDWIVSSELTILNDSNCATRFSRTTGGLSSPDLSLAGSSIAPKCVWTALDAIGNSDHLPLLTTIHLVVEHQHVLGCAPKWKRNDVDWHKWTEEVENLCQSEPAKDEPTDRLVRLTEIMIRAGHSHVGKTKPGKTNRSWLNQDAREAIKDRNKKRKLFCDEAHILQTCQADNRWGNGSKETKDAIRKQAKTSLKDD